MRLLDVFLRTSKIDIDKDLVTVTSRKTFQELLGIMDLYVSREINARNKLSSLYIGGNPSKDLREK